MLLDQTPAAAWPGSQGHIDSAQGRDILLGALVCWQVYLVPYKVEDYKPLVAPLGIWPFPRGHFRGLTRIPVGVRSHGGRCPASLSCTTNV